MHAWKRWTELVNLRCPSEKSKLQSFRFPELLQPSRGIFRVLASATRQGHHNWSVYVSRLAGRNRSIQALSRMSSAARQDRCRQRHSRDARAD
jgi:hypothetical protein